MAFKSGNKLKISIIGSLIAVNGRWSFLKVKTECLHLLIGVDYVVSLMTERVLS